MNWAEAPFIEYLNAVDDLLEGRYGVTSDDTGMELIAASQEAGIDPAECVDEIAGKYELVDITRRKE